MPGPEFLCAGYSDPDAFFPSGRTAPDRVAAALALCGACPATTECADMRQDAGGIWAGVLHAEPRVTLDEVSGLPRRPGRPVEHDPVDLDALQEAWLNMPSVAAIVSHSGLSKGQVYRIAREEGWPSRLEMMG